MAEKNHVTDDMKGCGEPFVPHGQTLIPVKFLLDLFSCFGEEDLQGLTRKALWNGYEEVKLVGVENES